MSEPFKSKSTGELKHRAEKEIGNLSKKISSNYQAEDIEADEHGHHGATSIRQIVHNDKEIVIKTHYEITIDGKPFKNHVMVDDRGRVHSHGLPNYAYSSMLDLIKRLIDADKDRPDNDDSGEKNSYGGQQ